MRILGYIKETIRSIRLINKQCIDHEQALDRDIKELNELVASVKKHNHEKTKEMTRKQLEAEIESLKEKIDDLEHLINSQERHIERLDSIIINKLLIPKFKIEEKIGKLTIIDVMKSIGFQTVYYYCMDDSGEKKEMNECELIALAKNT